MREIQLTKGRVALVDDRDFEWLNQWKWQVKPSKHVQYATRRVLVAGKQTVLYMHRVLLGEPAGVEVDHRDGNGLNNQSANLRPASSSQNNYNRRKQRDCSSSFKGVWWFELNKKWVAYIHYYGRKQNLGSFKSEMEAAQAYDKAARRMFGAFAAVNFPVGNEQSCHREAT